MIDAAAGHRQAGRPAPVVAPTRPDLAHPDGRSSHVYRRVGECGPHDVRRPPAPTT